VYLIVCGFSVWLIIPGVGLLYGGLARRKSALSILFQSLMVVVFKLYGMGGIVGSFLTGVFATASVSSLDGATLAPGGIDGNGVQVGKQFAEIAGISSYAFTVSLILCYVLKYVPGMHLRVSDEAETVGLDLDQFFDEQIGDWSLFELLAGSHRMVRPISALVTPLPEEEKQDSNA
jgi:ammonia channel protein AmtB